MDAFRSKGSRISGLADLSSRVNSREGKKQAQNQTKPLRFSADSSSCHRDTLGEDTLTFELGWRPSHKTVGTPMKSLLSQAMSKENESKRRSPSIIARLMGLDGLPPQNPSHKQYRSPENHQQRTTSSEKAQRSSTFHGHRSFRKSSKDEQEFKDVFEVIDTPKVESSRYICQGSSNTNLTEAEMAFIRQKFMEAKCLSTDEKLQHSKEFHDALEALDSNKDLLLKFLQHPDSLFTKHLQDLQSVVPELQHCGHVSSMKSSNGHHNRESSIKGQNTEKEVLRRSQSRSPHKYCAPSIPSCSRTRQVAYSNTPELPKIELEERGSLQPTRIVVLKPNIGKTRNADRTLSSPGSPSNDFRADCRLPCTRIRESEIWGKKTVHEDASFSRHKSRDSREIAKEITRQMRKGCGQSGSTNFQTSRLRGYVGDESSSGSDTASESDLVPVTSRPTFNRKNKYRSLSSRSTESSVSREATKRLSERWKMTHKSEQLGEFSRSSTLAEMLAISDREARPASFNGVIFEEKLGKKFESKLGPPELVEPLGISSREGWKDGCVRNLSSNSRFSKAIMNRGSPHFDKIVIPKEMMKRERNKSVKGNSYNDGEDFLSSNSRSVSKKSHSSLDSSPEINFNLGQVEHFSVDDRLFEQNVTTSETNTSFSLDVNADNDNLADSGDVMITEFSELSHLDLSAPTSSNDPTKDPDALRFQDLTGGPSMEPSNSSVPELQSPASAKESDQPSPVSVLEASFPDDFSSSSECFESLSADLHGLRMQLQLLKLESGAYGEGPMLVSSDEDPDQEESSGLTEEKAITQESQEDWKSLFLVDVLANSRFSDTDPDTFMATWHSSESPVSPTLFEELEKKYSKVTSSTRCQRKFLFDRINSELLEIFKQFADPHPWVKPTRVGPVWDINELQDTLRKLVAEKEEKASKDMMEKVLERGSQWLNLEDDIDVIGREIEKLLTDELIAEIAVAI